MPIYEYRCENGHTFEVMQRMTDDALTTCQVCEAPVQKVLSAPAVHFKGSGFYTTDYGKKKSVGGGSNGSGSSSEPSSSDSGSSGSDAAGSGSSGSDSDASSSSGSKPDKAATKPD